MSSRVGRDVSALLALSLALLVGCQHMASSDPLGDDPRRDERTYDRGEPSERPPVVIIQKVSTGENRSACELAGGTWARFQNGCRDSCRAARLDEPMCTLDEPFGCECGPQRCWNGRGCEPH